MRDRKVVNLDGRQDVSGLGGEEGEEIIIRI